MAVAVRIELAQSQRLAKTADSRLVDALDSPRRHRQKEAIGR